MPVSPERRHRFCEQESSVSGRGSANAPWATISAPSGSPFELILAPLVLLCSRFPGGFKRTNVRGGGLRVSAKPLLK